MKNKFAALFVIYNIHNKEILNIKKMITSFDFSFIFDNTEILKLNHTFFKKIKNTCYFSYGKNYGLAFPYNYVIKIAKKEFDWLAIFDQDSYMSSSDIINMRSICQTINNNVMLVTPFVKYKNALPLRSDLEEISWAINSGSFLNLRILNRNENISYDENYFVDRLDKDFCKQIKSKHFSIIRANSIVLEHNLGIKSTLNTQIHEPLRNYYIARNRLYFNHKYYGILQRYSLNILQFLRHIFYIITSGYDVRKNLVMIFRGILDYFHGEMGKADFL